MNSFGTFRRLFLGSSLFIIIFAWWSRELTPSTAAVIFCSCAVMAAIRLPQGRRSRRV